MSGEIKLSTKAQFKKFCPHILPLGLQGWRVKITLFKNKKILPWIYLQVISTANSWHFNFLLWRSLIKKKKQTKKNFVKKCKSYLMPILVLKKNEIWSFVKIQTSIGSVTNGRECVLCMCATGFVRFFGLKIQGLFKDFQGHSFHFSRTSRTAKLKDVELLIVAIVPS